jgi:EAL and modified HD-GYP domain-containing signal transduction protein
MKLLYSKHPIFDKELKVFGYELLYRDMDAAESGAADDNIAAGKMMAEVLGNDEISGKTLGQLAFVNFSKAMLISKIAYSYPADLLVIVLSDEIEIDSDVMDCCQELREKGYIIALTDVSHGEKSLFRYANILSLDWRSKLNPSSVSSLKGRMRFLATNIDTQQDYELAKQAGFTFYQGFFFAKPVLISKQSHEPSRVTTMQLMSEAMRRPMSFPAISNIIQRDAVATFKLLKMVNSAYYSLRNEIKDVRHAVSFLGEIELRKWVILLSMLNIGKDKPDELVRFSLRRAEFCQGLAKHLRVSHEEYFLIGLLSLIDVVMGCTMEQALSEIIVADTVRNALTATENKPARILEALKSYELGDWDAAEELFGNISIPIETVAGMFSEADRKSYQILS